ncbi:MAG TPA: radical SAM protein, partial [Elusimicrobiota bacterium]|nr:radical SAM protein [Elusimicrobiota bacterium]
MNRTVLGGLGKWGRARIARRTDGEGVTLLILEPTLVCNSRCSACYNLNRLNPPPVVQITLAEIESVARALPHLAVLSLSGGEPTMHPCLSAVVEVFERHCRPLAVNLPTNGVNPAQVAAAVEGVCGATRAQVVVHLSVDGIGEEHDRIRGVPGNFESLRDTRARLRELQKHCPHLRLSVNTCLSARNRGSYRDILAWVEREWPEIEAHSVS